MKSMKQLLAACWVALVVGFAGAEPAICVNSIHQRYPWNGMVDVNYTVTGLVANHNYKLRFRVTNLGGEQKTFTASSSPTADGTFTAAFNAAADNAYPNTFARNLSLVASLVDMTQGGALPPDATGVPLGTSGAMGDVMVVDVSGGASAGEYPVEYYSDVDMGCFNCSVYKTDKIVLRWIQGGSYMVGYDDNAVDNPPRSVRTQGFYIGLFPITRRQYWNVMEWSNLQEDWETPIAGVSWNSLRDSNRPGVTIEASWKRGFISRLLAKAKCNGEAVAGFDLPTEWQWEIACRAGWRTLYYWGDSDAFQGDYMWWTENSGFMSHAVGQKLPNAWGLYDCLGNVGELCRNENYRSNLTIDIVDADNAGGSGLPGRVARGGTYDGRPEQYSCHYRTGVDADMGSDRYGFRLYRSIR